MEENRLLKYIRYSFTGLFFISVFIFFTFFYNAHLHFEEQYQLFLFTGGYFIEKLGFPGGFSGYTGGFLTQFYYLSIAGPLIIAILLLGIQQATYRILSSINSNPVFYLLSFIPALNGAMILCDEFYPLSAVVGFLIALLAGWLYVSIRKRNRRFLSGLILLVLAYWLTGGSYLMLLGVMLIFEILESLKARRLNNNVDSPEEAIFERLQFWQPVIYIILAGGLPLLVRQFLILQPLGITFISEYYYDMRTVMPKAIPVLFALPSLLMLILFFLPSKNRSYKIAVIIQIALLIAGSFFGFMRWANFGAEDIMKYDQYVRRGRWNDAIAFAKKNPPRNNLSLAMLNLSLAKEGKMGDMMFGFKQNGVGGLFLPFTREYVAPMMGSEILYELGLINASQEYAFESMETTPNLSKSVRSLKRLAETNLINKNYEVSRKYLKILEKTLFYHKWAEKTEKYLYNEEMINNHPVWGEKRKMMITTDFFFKVDNIEAILNMLMRQDQNNKVAYQYLMAFYLINKDLRNFMSRLPMMNDIGFKKIPVSWEEAIMYVVGLTTTNPMVNTPFRISDETKMRMKAYAEIYTTRNNAEELLRKRYSGTYWYYFHYTKLEVENQK
jgi:hypothetical protein